MIELRYWLRTAAGIGLAIALAACAPTSSGPYAPDFSRGVWGSQSITPPPGLLTARQGSLVGRTVTTAGGESLVVDYVLVDPSSGAAQYVVTSSPRSDRLIFIPVSALRLSPTEVWTDADGATLVDLPHVTLSELTHRYPRTVLTPVPVAAPPVAAAFPPAGPGGLPPVTVLPAVPTAVPPLELVRRGSVVGLQAVDSYGDPVGSVDAVAIVPATGAVRYAIIGGPSFGPGYYIAVPASSAQLSDGRVVLAGSLTNWNRYPRYRDDQLDRAFGAQGRAD